MYKIFKKFFDVIFSLVGIIVSSPVWIIAIIGILINDFGPVFYKTRRIGKDDKEFVMYKFRSMRVEKDADEKSLRPDSERIFAWGKVIRKLKIDELPQLVCILVGTMSFVGPRPVAKDQFDIFRVGKYDGAKAVKPGLTGPGALYDYIYGDKFEDSDIEQYVEKVLPTRRELEVAYVKKMGFFFDLKMIVWTAWCVICSLFGKMPKGIYNCLVNTAETEKTNTEETYGEERVNL